MRFIKYDYSIVIPVYFNEGCLEGTMKSIKEKVVAENPHLTYEVIFIDDGSGDNSLEEMLRVHRGNPQTVKVIKLTRNFGQVNALLAGFAHARGKCIIALSADGQDPPSLISEMLKAHFQEGYDIALCTRGGRDESYYRIITSRIFYALMKKLTFPNMPKGGFDCFLLSEKALKTFLRNIDAHPFFQGNILWMGYKIKFIEYHRRERLTGKSRWTFGKKLTYLIDGVLAYSFLPLRLSSCAGILVSFFGLIYAIIILVSKMLGVTFIKGWSPLMIVILVIGGLQLLMIGILGEYMWRILAQTRKRDLYIIDTIYDNQAEQ